MIIVLRPDSTPEQIDHVLDRIASWASKRNLSQGQVRTIIGVIGEEDKLQVQPLQAIPASSRCCRSSSRSTRQPRNDPHRQRYRGERPAPASSRCASAEAHSC